jgi:hypothetical protein
MIKTAAIVEKKLARIESAVAKGGTTAATAVKAYPPTQFIGEFNVLYQEHEQIKNLMINAIKEEKAEVTYKINELLSDVQEENIELTEGQVLERSQQIKEQIDKVIGKKKVKKDVAALNESLTDLGLIKTEEDIEKQDLQRLRAYLNYLNQMEAAIASAK